MALGLTASAHTSLALGLLAKPPKAIRTHDAGALMNPKRSQSPRRGQNRSRPSNVSQNGPPAPGNWKQSRERYLALAEAAAKSGDVVQAENYYQHAEHYLRLMRQSA
jgi:hypothetical protein